MKLKELLTVIPFDATYRITNGNSETLLLDYYALNYLPNVQVLSVCLKPEDKEHLTIVLDCDRL